LRNCEAMLFKYGFEKEPNVINENLIYNAILHEGSWKTGKPLKALDIICQDVKQLRLEYLGKIANNYYYIPRLQNGSLKRPSLYLTNKSERKRFDRYRSQENLVR